MKRTFLFLGLLGWSLGLNAADANATKAPKAGTHKVKAGPFKVVVEFKGTFAAEKSYPIRVRSEAWADLTVATNAVPHGSTVSTNDVLVSLKTDKLEQKIADSQLSFEVAKLDMAVAEMEYAFATNAAAMDKATAVRALARLQEDFDRYKEKTKAYSEKSAKFSLVSGQHSLAYVEEELKQLKKMYEADDLTEETEEIIIKSAQHSVARSQHFLERTRLSTEAALKFSLPRELQDKQNAVDRLELSTTKTTGTYKDKLEKLGFGLAKQVTDLKRAGEALAKLERDLKLMTVRAPTAGVVYYGKFTDGVWGGQKLVKAKLRKEGKLASGEVFMTVVEKGPLQVLGAVGEKDLLKVSQGHTGWATPTAKPADRVRVTVTRISRVPTAPGQFALTLSAKVGKKAYLLPGMSCTVKLVMHDKKSVFTVPSNALHQNAAGEMIVKVMGAKGEVTEKVVKTGPSHGGKTEITEGLKAGDEVVLP